jgi:hypothetical protein
MTSRGEDMIERVAKAIYDANDKLSGDPIGVVIVASEHLFPQRSHMEGNSSAKAYQLAAMDVCRSAARAAIEAMMEPALEAAYVGDPHDTKAPDMVSGRPIEYVYAYGYANGRHDAVEALRTSLTGDTK